MPGVLIAALILKTATVENLAAYFVLSITLWAPFIILAYLLGLKLSTVLLLVTVSIALVALFFIRKKGHLSLKPKLAKKSFGKVIFGSALLILLYFVLRFTLPINLSSDSPFHFAHVRNMASQNRAINEEAVIIMDAPANKINPGYKDNGWYVIWATASSSLKISPQYFAKIANPLLIILGMLAAGYLVESLGGDRTTRYLTYFFYLLLIYLFRPLDGVTAFWPNRIGHLIILPTILAFFISYLKSMIKSPEEKFFLYAGGLGIVTAGLVHNMALIYSLLVIAGYTGLTLVLHRKENRWRLDLQKSLKFLLIATVGLLPLVALRAKAVNDFSGYMSNLAPGDQTVTINDRLYFYDFSFLQTAPYLVSLLITAAATSTLVLRRKKLPPWLILALSSFFVVLLLRQNPLVAPLLTKIISNSYMERLNYIIPVAVILPFAYRSLFPKQNNRLRSYLPLIMLLGTIVLFWNPLYSSGLKKAIEKREPFRDMVPLSAYINSNLPPGSRIATEKASGYALAGLSNVRVIAIHPSHTSAYAQSDYTQRVADLETLFEANGEITPAERLSLLRKYRADYQLVVLKNNYALKNSRNYKPEKILEDLTADNNLTEVYRDKYYVLFKVVR